MKIAYASRTGNVQRFINKLKAHLPDREYIKVDEYTVITEPFILITYTTGFGEMPKEVQSLIYKNKKHIRAVVGSGNRNWGNHFCGGADKVSQECNVPTLHKFELSGLDSDVEIVSNKIVDLERME